jgi:GT2 family glycosyltransferase
VTDRDLKPISIEPSSRKASALEDLLLLGNVVGSPSSPLIERRLLLEVGGFDRAYSHCADWELWVRLARKTEFLYIPEPLVTYRQHGGNMSRQIETLERESRSLLDAAFGDPELPPAVRALRARSMGRNWMVLAGAYFNARRYVDFGRCATRALLLDPSQIKRLFSFPRRRLAGVSDWRRDLP